MISFHCPRCGKALILPNREAGKEKTCPDCGAAFVVPDPPARQRASRLRRLLPATVTLLIVSVLLGFWVFKARRPARIQGRFAERLHQLSSRWQGIEWLECDPIHDHFKVSVYYGSDRGTYHLEANGSQGSGPTIVRVNPPHWLAHARYLGAVEESFEYHGDDGSERIELQTLAGDLSDALRQALR